ncbi:hypothetical protein [Flavobacterium restrictum]|uniref:Lipoprotein n=1 Tax=Flavobacterium restrictum TaxID=2594428 RepID=A0A553DQ57_9FLAO|nr:hypothetical protein [Flavobacterium restrictum]TRX34924.1 hypothetical protein FNW21_15745 [Flavobacterium restrictum]
MKYKLLFSLALIALFGSCKRETVEKKYYVISNADSISEAWKKSAKVPPPFTPHNLKWYSDVVFILDSSKVYAYQTERTHTGSGNNVDFEYPNYIGLNPEYFLTIDSENFVSFIENNNDIFGIFPDNSVQPIIYLASQTDTVKNIALPQLWEKLKDSKSRTFFSVRRTTEEENIVLSYKKKNKEFLPEKVKWSTNFYNGKVKPFTKDYQKIEETNQLIRKAKETFKQKKMSIEM